MRAVVIDDHPQSLKQIIEALKELPWNIEIAGFPDGKGALNYLSEQTVSLVVMETTIDGMDGVEIARRIKLIQPNVYLVFATENPGRALDAFRVRADGYLMKPLDKRALRGAILTESIA